MATYAKIDENNIVINVISAEQSVIDSGALGDPKRWIQTSRNTREGVHMLVGGIPLRKNYAGIGYTYDAERDAFIPPKRFDSWVLNEETCTWQAPIPQPDMFIRNGLMISHSWNEDSRTWEEFESEIDEEGANP